MKCFTDRVALMSVTVLISSCVAINAAPPARVPILYTNAAPDTGICPLVFENGATADNINMFGPQNDWLNDHQPTARGAAAVQPLGRSQLARDALEPGGAALSDDTVPAAALMGVKIANSAISAGCGPTLNYLASRGWEFPGRVRSPALDQPATPATSSESANGQMNFRTIDSLAQIAPKNDVQTRQIEGMNTRAWTTIVGWHPGESAFPDARTDEAQLNLVSIAF
jgi:hypothetical protein